jgi:hypothetical protein
LREYHRLRGQLDEGYKFFKPTAEKLGWLGWQPFDGSIESSTLLEETLQLLDIDAQARPATVDRQTVLGKVLARYARFSCESPDKERAALQVRQDALQALNRSGNVREMAWVLRYLGHVQQQPFETEQLYQTALTHFKAQNDDRGIAETHYRLGVNALDQGNFENAIHLIG